MHHRIGFVRKGYDADVVVWDRHPLSLAATPLQVFIDGDATLDMERAASLLPVDSEAASSEKPRMRKAIDPRSKAEFCAQLATGSSITVKGIKQSFLRPWPKGSQSGDNDNALVIENGKISCFGPSSDCAHQGSKSDTHIQLQDGYVLPGLTAFTNHLGLAEWRTEASTSDGEVTAANLMVAESLVHAKHGVTLESQLFGRAQLGGVTRAIVPPLQRFRSEGSWGGLSVGIKTGQQHTILDGGIFQDDVALHVMLGPSCKGKIPRSNDHSSRAN